MKVDLKSKTLTKKSLFLLDEPTKELLRIRAFELRITQAELIRRALASYLDTI